MHAVRRVLVIFQSASTSLTCWPIVKRQSPCGGRSGFVAVQGKFVLTTCLRAPQRRSAERAQSFLKTGGRSTPRFRGTMTRSCSESFNWNHSWPKVCCNRMIVVVAVSIYGLTECDMRFLFFIQWARVIEKPQRQCH